MSPQERALEIDSGDSQTFQGFHESICSFAHLLICKFLLDLDLQVFGADDKISIHAFSGCR